MKTKSKSYGIASMLCGAFSIPLVIAPYFGLPLSILAVVFNYKQKQISPNGLGIAGMVMGIIGIVLNSVMVLFLLLALLFIYSFKSVFA